MYLLCCLSLETSINPFQGVRIIPSLPVWKRRFYIMKIAIRELVHTETGNPEYAGTRTGRTKSGYCIKIELYFFFASIYVVYFNLIFFFIFVILRVFRLYRYGGMFRSSDYCVWACSVIPVWSGIPRFSAFRWF